VPRVENRCHGVLLEFEIFEKIPYSSSVLCNGLVLASGKLTVLSKFAIKVKKLGSSVLLFSDLKKNVDLNC
jgi:hypothetical protein